MKYRIVFFISAVLIFITALRGSGNDFSTLLINQKYNSCLAKIDSLSNPHQKMLLKTAVYTQYMIDHYNNKFEDSLKNIVEEAEKFVPNNDTDDFVKGGIFLNFAFYLQFRGNMWKALNYGRKGIGYLRKVESKSCFYNDALLGVALYDYGMGKLFFSGKRIAKGINELNIVSDSGDYFDGVADNFKILFLYNERRYDEGLKESFSLFGKYPDSRLVLWNLVKGFKYKDENDSLIKYVNLLINNIKNDSVPNNYNLLTLYKWEINAYLKSGEKDKARIVFDNVKRMNLNHRYVKDVIKLRKDIVDRYSFMFKKKH